jgi:hypothetical protein
MREIKPFRLTPWGGSSNKGSQFYLEWSLRGEKNSVLAANRESPDARDQALSFDTLGGLIQQGVTVVFQHLTSICFAAKIGRRKNGFGAPEKKN